MSVVEYTVKTAKCCGETLVLSFDPSDRASRVRYRLEHEVPGFARDVGLSVRDITTSEGRLRLDLAAQQALRVSGVDLGDGMDPDDVIKSVRLRRAQKVVR